MKKNIKKKVVKCYVVEWFGEIMPVSEKIPSLYLSKKKAQEHFKGEKITIIPATITFPTKK